MKKTVINGIHGVISILIAVTFLTVGGCQKKKVVPQGVEVTFKSEPAGTKVFWQEKELGVTPMKTRAMAGKYIFKFAKDGYHEYWEKINIPKTGSKVIDIRLEPVTAMVMIQTEPTGAKVEINGRIVGETPLILKNLPLGQHKAYLRMLNYVPREISWEITDARPKLITQSMISNIGTLSIKSKPEGANIIIDGSNRGLTPLQTDIEQGAHKIEINKPGYADFKQVVTIERGKSKEVEAELQILPGAIKITSTPPDASVFLNDKQYENTPTEIKGLQPGQAYKVRLEKEGFDPNNRVVDVLPGRTVELNIPLDSNTGGIDLVVHPPGVTVYFDGKVQGISQVGERPELSEVFKIRDISMGKHKIRLSHKRATPPDVNLTVRVPKGGIAWPDPVWMWIADTELLLKDGTRIRPDPFRQPAGQGNHV